MDVGGLGFTGLGSLFWALGFRGQGIGALFWVLGFGGLRFTGFVLGFGGLGV